MAFPLLIAFRKMIVNRLKRDIPVSKTADFIKMFFLFVNIESLQVMDVGILMRLSESKLLSRFFISEFSVDKLKSLNKRCSRMKS